MHLCTIQILNPYKDMSKRWNCPLLCRCTFWMWCDIVHNGWIYIRLFDSLNLPCTKSRLRPRLRSQHMWPMWGELGLTFDTPCRWGVCACDWNWKRTLPLSSRTNCGDALPSWSGWKTMVVAENVARFQRDRRHWKGGSWESNGKMVPWKFQADSSFTRLDNPLRLHSVQKTLCQYISTD